MRKITEYSKKKASEHVYYEGWMLYENIVALMDIGNEKVKERNVLLDSFAVHARNLFNFLYPPRSIKPDDIIVFDYIDNKSLYLEKRTKKNDLKFIIKKADKQVAHLTYLRNKYSLKRKEWQFIKIGQMFHISLRAFYEAMPKHRQQWKYFNELKKILDVFS